MGSFPLAQGAIAVEVVELAIGVLEQKGTVPFGNKLEFGTHRRVVVAVEVLDEFDLTAALVDADQVNAHLVDKPALAQRGDQVVLRPGS